MVSGVAESERPQGWARDVGVDRVGRLRSWASNVGADGGGVAVGMDGRELGVMGSGRCEVGVIVRSPRDGAGREEKRINWER
ncbi:hypothetical protein COCNU_11G004660 [Cocos nucifera]|uniref:Uncharacterized protein n=1 Tax=Cocos nucifera TaxID=13894 RepID=A0A8K0INV7_COCNU|nr:hypothetical protein COCNU_11G004660 [Cocos nucifera]